MKSMEKNILSVFLVGCLFANATKENNAPGVLLEDDIMLTEDEDPWDRRTSLLDMKSKRWPGGIVPYDLNETEYTLVDLYVIRDGMKEIEKDTCIRFVPRKKEQDYVYITSNGGCWSYLGRKGFEQTLSLVAPQCINRGTVIHEFMHALGFWHEHSRPDRDEHIEVLWDNIISKEKQVNFAKHITGWQNLMDLPYDYRSVMHYSAYTFSKLPTLPTLKPKDKKVRLKELGRAKVVGTLTDIDKKKINILYECSTP